jgi:hypothetical protein
MDVKCEHLREFYICRLEDLKYLEEEYQKRQEYNRIDYEYSFLPKLFGWKYAQPFAGGYKHAIRRYALLLVEVEYQLKIGKDLCEIPDILKKLFFEFMESRNLCYN